VVDTRRRPAASDVPCRDSREEQLLACDFTFFEGAPWTSVLQQSGRYRPRLVVLVPEANPITSPSSRGARSTELPGVHPIQRAHPSMVHPVEHTGRQDYRELHEQIEHRPRLISACGIDQECCSVNCAPLLFRGPCVASAHHPFDMYVCGALWRHTGS